MRLILKTTVSSPAEIPFLWMMFREARGFVDHILVTEFNQTHSGLPRQFMFDRFYPDFVQEFPQLTYLQGVDVDGMVPYAKTPAEQHQNETLMRGWFAKQFPLRSSDVIVSTDADEVLYQSTYSWIVKNFSWRSHGVRFRLHQFFYRPNLLWLNKEFIAPVALKFGRYSKTFPNNWRYQGTTLPGFWGAHFSWCIPVKEMAQKVKNYAHAADFDIPPDEKFFTAARAELRYPFESGDSFRLTAISPESNLLPASFALYRDLIPAEVLGGLEGGK